MLFGLIDLLIKFIKRLIYIITLPIKAKEIIDRGVFILGLIVLFLGIFALIYKIAWLVLVGLVVGLVVLVVIGLMIYSLNIKTPKSPKIKMPKVVKLNPRKIRLNRRF